MTGFHAHVLEWLRTEGGKPEAFSVEKVAGWGNDMVGSTDAGFHEQFEVTIYYTDASGKARTDEVDGERLASLWQWVVQAWPGEEHR